MWLRRVRVIVAPSLGGTGREFLFDAQDTPHGFRMEASIERDDTREPDECEVSLWGLGDDERDFIQGDSGLAVQVFAGHEGEDLLRFAGDIDEDSVEVVDEHPGFRITFKAGESRTKFRWTRLDRTFSEPNVTAATLFRRFADHWGVELAPLPSDLPIASWPRGFTARGPLRNSTERVARRVKARAQLQGDRLVVTRIGRTSPETAPLLRGGTLDQPGTGLIGTPTITREGIEFVTLLRSGLLPQRKVRIESPVFRGSVKIQTTKERLTTHGTDFSIACEGVVLDADKV